MALLVWNFQHQRYVLGGLPLVSVSRMLRMMFIHQLLFTASLIWLLECTVDSTIDEALFS